MLYVILLHMALRYTQCLMNLFGKSSVNVRFLEWHEMMDCCFLSQIQTN